jgi:cell division protease FtsH
VSKQLIQEMTWLCALHGVKAGVRRIVMPAGRVIKRTPLPENEAWTLVIGKTNHWIVRERSKQQKAPVVRRVTRKPYDGYVYDLCGCDNEAFFGGEKPVLLHNSRVRDLFETGKKHAPCILFIDEIDAVGRHRGAGLGGGHDEREQTLNQLLVEMDGFESNEGVILLAATNRPDVLDPALMRPGRFDRRIVVDLPDVRGREGILKVHSRKTPLADDVDLGVLARATPGMSGADLANVINEAALLAARANMNKVTMDVLEEAKDKIYLGPERKSRVVKEEVKRLTAYHEAGHAVVGSALEYSDPVHKVTIIPRGQAGGLTFFLPEDDRTEYSKNWCLDTLTQALGGRVAEELVLNRMGSGASSDIQMVSKLVRRMVTQWGMSERLGPIAFGERDEQVFLGRDIVQRTEYSDRTAQLIDDEVKRIVDEAYLRAKKILEDRIDILHRMANALLERETLDAPEIKIILEGGVLPPLPAAPTPAPAKEAAPETRPETDRRKLPGMPPIIEPGPTS